MFMLTQLEDSIRVEPGQLGMPTAIALEEQIKNLYFDKVIKNVGLVVSFYDFVSISGGDVHNGDGGVHFIVQFNLVIFRPFEGEVLLGRILKSNEYVQTLTAVQQPVYGAVEVVVMLHFGPGAGTASQ